jgi:hypothetical protein
VKTAVDTNALLALLYDDRYADASEAALREAYQAGPVVVSPIVYAELAADGQFDTRPELDRFLEDFSIQLVEPSADALFIAGEQFRTYADRRPDGLQCPSCGAQQTAECDACGEFLAPRQHIASDFIIGGHAAVDADALVSFDMSFYRTYFPSLTVYPQSDD